MDLRTVLSMLTVNFQSKSDFLPMCIFSLGRTVFAKNFENIIHYRVYHMYANSLLYVSV